MAAIIYRYTELMHPFTLNPVPNLYYICCGFLARAWLIALIQVVSFNQQQSLLAIFYPVKASFYLSLSLGIPAIITLIFNRFERWGHPLLHRWAKTIIALSLLCDIGLQIKNISHSHLHYSLANALLLTLSCWLLLWILSSKKLSLCWNS